MMGKKANLAIILSILGISALAASILWRLASPDLPFSKEHPGDGEMGRAFFIKEEDLNQIIRMFDEDRHLFLVGRTVTYLNGNRNWPRPEAELGISVERWGEYRRLFEKAGVGDVRRVEGDVALMTIASRGWALDNDEKGYAYALREPPQVLDSLEANLNGTERCITSYKRLKGNWYLYRWVCS
jgi:hypothetical protein